LLRPGPCARGGCSLTTTATVDLTPRYGSGGCFSSGVAAVGPVAPHVVGVRNSGPFLAKKGEGSATSSVETGVVSSPDFVSNRGRHLTALNIACRAERGVRIRKNYVRHRHFMVLNVTGPSPRVQIAPSACSGSMPSENRPTTFTSLAEVAPAVLDVEFRNTAGCRRPPGRLDRRTSSFQGSECKPRSSRRFLGVGEIARWPWDAVIFS